MLIQPLVKALLPCRLLVVGLVMAAHLCPCCQVCLICLKVLALQVMVTCHNSRPDGEEALQIGICNPEAVHGPCTCRTAMSRKPAALCCLLGGLFCRTSAPFFERSVDAASVPVNSPQNKTSIIPSNIQNCKNAAGRASV